MVYEEDNRHFRTTKQRRNLTNGNQLSHKRPRHKSLGDTIDRSIDGSIDEESHKNNDDAKLRGQVLGESQTRK